jgi:hypothetical protein
LFDRGKFTNSVPSLDWMSNFEVRCVAGEDHFCIEVPMDCSVGDVLEKASEHSGVNVKDASLWCSDVELIYDHLFADYFEPEAIYQLKLAWNYPEDTLLSSSQWKLRRLGVDLTAPRLLIAMEDLKWRFGEFWEKAGGFAPTLLLIKMKNGTECGGVAGVPWPRNCEVAADYSKKSFIFSLGASPARFDLVSPDWALYCMSWSFGFGYGGGDLFVRNNGGGCGSAGQGDYAGPREKGQLVGGAAEASLQSYERWEMWRL